MYRLIKMTDFVRFNTKVEKITDALTEFRQEMESQHKKYLKRKETTFVSWIKM